MTTLSGRTGEDIRAKLKHPVVDSDGHMMETTFAILDFVRKVGGPEIARRYETMLQDDANARSRRAVWVSHSGAGFLRASWAA